jgi:hypothetical protein
VVARQRDKKVNSYKLALARALNDVVLSYPDLYGTGLDVCVPLRKLAEYWLAYYWPFVDPQDPVMQGPRAMRGGVLGNDAGERLGGTLDLLEVRGLQEIIVQAGVLVTPHALESSFSGSAVPDFLGNLLEQAAETLGEPLFGASNGPTGVPTPVKPRTVG